MQASGFCNGQQMPSPSLGKALLAHPTSKNPAPGDVGYPVPGVSGTGVAGSRVGLAPGAPDPTRAKHYTRYEADKQQDG
ncbi:hypothetical protein EV361DRAFT_954868 [Lentinula raphanica]|nr:hypothetical protein EV361DRAFT_954868 [Lentinula raphanica]